MWHLDDFCQTYLGLLQDSLCLRLLGRHHWALLGITSILELEKMRKEELVPTAGFPKCK